MLRRGGTQPPELARMSSSESTGGRLGTRRAQSAEPPQSPSAPATASTQLRRQSRAHTASLATDGGTAGLRDPTSTPTPAGWNWGAAEVLASAPAERPAQTAAVL